MNEPMEGWFVIKDEEGAFLFKPGRWEFDLKRATWYSPCAEAERMLALVQDDCPECEFEIVKLCFEPTLVT